MLRSLRRNLLAGGFVAVAMLSGMPLSAQNAAIVYAEGGDFSVIRQQQEDSYNVAADNVLGLALSGGDLVQTGNDTFLEIQMEDIGAIFKVAENTNFRLEYAGDDGSSRLELSYGRVRAKVETIAAGTFLEMRGLSVVAGVRGTDFGYDIVVTPQGGGEPVLQIYTFEGSVVVAEGDLARDPALSYISESAAQTTIQSGQMIAVPLSTVVSGNVQQALAQPPSTITTEVRDFWDAHPFETIAGEAPQVAGTPGVMPPGAPTPGAPTPQSSPSEEPGAIEPLDPLPPFAFAPNALAVAGPVEPLEEAVEETAAEETASEETDDEASTGEGWKRAGTGMAVLGTAVALTGVAMYFALNMVDVPASYTPSVSPGIALMIGGGGLAVGGLGAYLTGVFIGNSN